jgi:cytidine deaminase
MTSSTPGPSSPSSGDDVRDRAADARLDDAPLDDARLEDARLDDARLEDARLDELVAAARGAMAHACCQFSRFPVGAALLAADSRIYTGVNVESSSWGGTICAERTALVKALSEGVRDFIAIAVTTDATSPTMPCGICRQLLHDYAPGLIVVAEADGSRVVVTLAELLPMPFGATDLEAYNAEGGRAP